MADYIQIPDVPPYVRYVADGNHTHFDFAFPVFASEDVEVYLGDESQSNGYEVFGVGETGGGTVTFDSPPAAGTVVTLRRRLTIARTHDLHNNRPVFGEELNAEADIQTAALQQVASDVARSLRLKATDADADLELPSRDERANRVLGFDGDGNAIAAAGATGATGATGGGGVTDHAELTGLADDDHGQYHTDARADAWFAAKSTDDLPEGKTSLYFPGFAGSGAGSKAARSDHGHADATASEPGFMSAVDKNKLDGIQAGAQANPQPVTAAEKSSCSDTSPRSFSPKDVAEIAAVHGAGGGGGSVDREIDLPVPAFADPAQPPKYEYVNGLPLQLFEEGNGVKWQFRMPQGFTASPVLKAQVAMEAAASGTLSLSASVDAVSVGDGQDVGTETYDKANTAEITVPGAAGTLAEVSIPLAFADNLSAGDSVRLKLERGGGTASGGMRLLSAALTYAS